MANPGGRSRRKTFWAANTGTFVGHAALALTVYAVVLAASLYAIHVLDRKSRQSAEDAQALTHVRLAVARIHTEFEVAVDHLLVLAHGDPVQHLATVDTPANRADVSLAFAALLTCPH